MPGALARVPMRVSANVEVADWHQLKSAAALASALEIGAREAIAHCRSEHPSNPIEDIGVYISAGNKRIGQLVHASRKRTDGPWEIERRGLDSLMTEMTTGGQQTLCRTIVEIRSRHRDLMMLINRETNPVKKQELSALRTPILNEAQAQMKFGEFSDFSGKITQLEGTGVANSYRVSILLDCPGDDPNVAAFSTVFTAPALNDSQSDFNRFRATLSSLSNGERVRFSGTNVAMTYVMMERVECGAVNMFGQLMGNQRDQCDKPVEFSARITSLQAAGPP